MSALQLIILYVYINMPHAKIQMKNLVFSITLSSSLILPAGNGELVPDMQHPA